ncbi:MAG: galactose-1-phosphate uridylyltransferase [Candidatus Bipolaricaulia bacterium]
MVEIRKEVTKDEWSIIASTRSERPFDFSQVTRESEEKNNSDCPFCPGNETATPPEIYAIRRGKEPGESDWEVRVFSNKFPALDQDGTTAVIESDLFKSKGGFGYHEVVAETPKHIESLTELEVEKLELVIQTYIERTRALSEGPEIEYVSVFRNQGKKAGASLSHPHSQIMATSFVPKLLETEYREARHFFEKKGSCLYCRLLEAERKEEERIVSENDEFVAFIPFGARFPYETHIYPRNHGSNFAEQGAVETNLLASMLKRTLSALGEEFGGYIPYNYSIHTGPAGGSEDYKDLTEAYHWHLEIIPRLTTPAGFERGSGNFINVVSPEQAARKLRKGLAQSKQK